MYKLDRFEKKKTIFSKTTSYVGEMPWGSIVGNKPAIVLNKDGSMQIIMALSWPRFRFIYSLVSRNAYIAAQ